MPDHPTGAAVQPRLAKVFQYLPRGLVLREETWRPRHQGILVLLWLHALALPILGYAWGFDLEHLLLEALVLPAFALIASWNRVSRRFRSTVASLGLLAASGILTHLSGGYIEAHFHFFVMIGVIALYQDWVPFLFAIAFVAIHHGTVGTFDPESVFNHPGAWHYPWMWAGIHAFFILGLSAANIVTWRANEAATLRTEASEHSLAVAQELAGMGSWTWEVGANKVTWSAQLYRIFGLEPGQFKATFEAYLECVHPDDRSFVAQKVTACLADGQPFQYDCRIIKPDGTERWIHARGGREADALGRPLQLAGTATDITEQRQAEQDRVRALEQAQEIEQLKELNRMRAQFLNSAAHELGTPMTPIKIQLHLMDSASDEKRVKALAVLRRNVDRMESLIKELLEAGRIQTGRLPLKSEPLDMTRLVREVSETFQEPAQQQGLSFGLRLSPGIQLKGDDKYLGTVVSNLVSNAIKFTPAPGSVTIELTSDGANAHLVVRDTGLGLSASQIGRLFQPFSRAHDGTNPAITGSGLGLFITGQIVERHGGRIWCTSDGANKGTAFHVTLPLEGVILLSGESEPVGHDRPSPTAQPA